MHHEKSADAAAVRQATRGAALRRQPVLWLLPLGLLLLGVAGDGLTTGPVLCPLRRLSGLPCPACGMTRATAALIGGDLGAATALHPLAAPLLAIALAWWLRAAVAAWRRRDVAPMSGRALIALATLLIVVWAVRLAMGDLP